MSTSFIQSAVDYSASSDTLSIDLSATPQDGDLMIALLSIADRTYAQYPTEPSGWTFVGYYNFGGGSRCFLYYKIASSETGDPYVWDYDVADRHRGTIAVYRGGFDTADPIDTYSNEDHGEDDVYLNADSLTVSAANSTLLFAGVNFGASSVTMTPPTNPGTFTEDIDDGDTSSRNWHHFCHYEWSSSGSTGDIIGTLSDALAGKHAFGIALNPESAVQYDEDLANTGFELSYSNLTATIQRAGSTTFISYTEDHSASETSVTLALPDGVEDDDLLLCQISIADRADNPTVPSGWTAFDYCDFGSSARVWLYYKVASSETGPYTWTWSAASNSRIRGTLVAYRGGFNPSNPIDTYSNYSNGDNDEYVTAGSITVSAEDSNLLFVGVRYGTSAVTLTPPTNPGTFTEDFDDGDVYSDNWHYFCNYLWSSSGATGDIVGTASSSGAARHAYAIALNSSSSTQYEDSLDNKSFNLSYGTVSATVSLQNALANKSFQLTYEDVDAGKTIPDSLANTSFELSYDNVGVIKSLTQSLANTDFELTYSDVSTGKIHNVSLEGDSFELTYDGLTDTYIYGDSLSNTSFELSYDNLIVTAPATLIIGIETDGTNTYVGDYAFWTYYVTNKAARITKLYLYYQYAPYIKWAVHLNNGGVPGDVVYAENTEQQLDYHSSPAWGSIDVDTPFVLNGSQGYFIAVSEDRSGGVYRTDHSNGYAYTKNVYPMEDYDFEDDPSGLTHQDPGYDKCVNLYGIELTAYSDSLANKSFDLTYSDISINLITGQDSLVNTEFELSYGSLAAVITRAESLANTSFRMENGQIWSAATHVAALANTGFELTYGDLSSEIGVLSSDTLANTDFELTYGPIWNVVNLTDSLANTSFELTSGSLSAAITRADSLANTSFELTYGDLSSEITSDVYESLANTSFQLTYGDIGTTRQLHDSLGNGEFSLTYANIDTGRIIAESITDSSFSLAYGDLIGEITFSDVLFNTGFLFTYGDLDDSSTGGGEDDLTNADFSLIFGGLIDTVSSPNISFKFIDYTENVRTSADATALTDNELDFPSVQALDVSILKFKIGNDESSKTIFSLSASGTATSFGTSIKDYVFFSINKFDGLGEGITYEEALEGDSTIDVTLGPNEVSPVIWAAFACHPDFVDGEAEVKIKVEGEVL
jgi:hypothetical protein